MIFRLPAGWKSRYRYLPRYRLPTFRSFWIWQVVLLYSLRNNLLPESRLKSERVEAFEIELFTILNVLGSCLSWEARSKGCGVALPHHTPHYSLADPGPIMEILAEFPSPIPPSVLRWSLDGIFGCT
jgi:hypothetical protein